MTRSVSWAVTVHLSLKIHSEKQLTILTFQHESNNKFQAVIHLNYIGDGYHIYTLVVGAIMFIFSYWLAQCFYSTSGGYNVYILLVVGTMFIFYYWQVQYLYAIGDSYHVNMPTSVM